MIASLNATVASQQSEIDVLKDFMVANKQLIPKAQALDLKVCFIFKYILFMYLYLFIFFTFFQTYSSVGTSGMKVLHINLKFCFSFSDLEGFVKLANLVLDIDVETNKTLRWSTFTNGQRTNLEDLLGENLSSTLRLLFIYCFFCFHLGWFVAMKDQYEVKRSNGMNFDINEHCSIIYTTGKRELNSERVKKVRTSFLRKMQWRSQGEPTVLDGDAEHVQEVKEKKKQIRKPRKNTKRKSAVLVKSDAEESDPEQEYEKQKKLPM